MAVPSQWEGETDDGREVYVRYRHGRLWVDVKMGDPETEQTHQDPGSFLGYRTVLSLDHGGLLDGSMLTREMLELAGIEYDGDPEVVDEEGDFWEIY